MKFSRLLWSNAVCVAPWLAAMLVVLTAGHINHVLDLPSLAFNDFSVAAANLDDAALNLANTAKQLGARISWGIPAIGFALVAVAVIATCMFIILDGMRKLQSNERLQCVIAIVVAAVVLLAIVNFGGDVLSEPTVTSNLRKATMHRTSATHAVSIDTAFDAVSFGIFALLLVASSCVLSWSKQTPASVSLLCERLKQIRWLLYMGATVLVLRAIEMYALYRWPGVWLNNEQAQLVDRMAQTLSTAHGAFYSAILVALYVPTMLIMRLRIKHFASGAAREANQDTEAWLDKVGLSVVPFKEVARVFATIAPFVVGGSIAKVVETFGG